VISCAYPSGQYDFPSTVNERMRAGAPGCQRKNLAGDMPELEILAICCARSGNHAENMSHIRAQKSVIKVYFLPSKYFPIKTQVMT
jgi:hypothetical protein